LSPFIAAHQEQDDIFSILPEVHTVAKVNVDFDFVDPITKRLYVFLSTPCRYSVDEG
jgi:hypothetical protein